MFKLEVPKNFLEELDIAMAKNNKAQKSYETWKRKKILDLEAGIKPKSLHEEKELLRLGIYETLEIRERKLQENYGLRKSFGISKLSKEIKAISKEINLQVKLGEITLAEADELKVGMVLRSRGMEQSSRIL